MMKMMKSSKKEITDLALAAFLSTVGHKFKAFRTDPGRKFVFIFEDSEKLNSDVLDYYNRATRVDPFRPLRFLRDLEKSKRVSHAKHNKGRKGVTRMEKTLEQRIEDLEKQYADLLGSVGKLIGIVQKIIESGESQNEKNRVLIQAVKVLQERMLADLPKPSEDEAPALKS